MSKNNTSDEDFIITPSLIYKEYAENHFAVIALYVPLFLSALAANIIVIVVVFKDQYMRSVTNYFLVNLSVADLLVTTVCMPNAAWLAYTTMYNYGEYTCKLSAYLQCISVASSIFTITAMSVDRYLAITRPFGILFRCFTKTTTVIVIVSIWLISLILFSPIMWIYGLRVDYFPVNDTEMAVAVCWENWSNFAISQHTLGIVWFVFMFAKPGLVMLFAYAMMGRTLCSRAPPFDSDSTSTQQRNRVIRGRKRVACILLVLAFVFAACWLPYHTMNLMTDLSNSTTSKNLKPVKRYLLLLGHANSALNPIIYCVLSRKFRSSIKGLFCVKVTFRRKRHLVKLADSSGSGTHLNYLRRLKNAPAIHNPLHLSLSSSQKTTKTIAAV